MTFYSTTNSQIWMGSLEPYMNEAFIQKALRTAGETPLRIKLMRDKNTGENAGYCFIHFENEETARSVLHKLNGKVIPNSAPPVRYKLNFAGPNNRLQGAQNEDFSLFVGDLSSEVDDYTLYKCLSARYPSIRTAKVVLDANGTSKGYAFVRFANENDQKRCTAEMHGYVGLGTKPIKIGTATPRESRWKKDNNSTAPSSNTVVPTYDYTQNYYDQAAAWHGYSWTANNYYYQQQQSAMSYSNFYSTGPSFEGNDDMALIDHTTPINVEEMNSAVINRDLDFWDSIEASKWSPVDTICA